MANVSSFVRGLSPGVPTPERPFAFFHMRKAGGTSIRRMLYRASQKHRLSAWVPGNGGLSTTPWGLPPVEQTAVFGGHLNYAQLMDLIKQASKEGRHPNIFHSMATATRVFRGRGGGRHEVTYRPVSDTVQAPLSGCLTNIRPTVSRIESCWHYWFEENGNNALQHWRLPRARDMSPEEWSALLPEAVDWSGFSCNNEFARIFGSTIDEATVSHLGPGRHGATFLRELDSVLSRLSRCVIIRVDRCKESNKILRHFVPWLEGDLCSVRMNVGGQRDSRLTAEAREAILGQNRFDEAAFQFAARMFEAQLEAANNASLSARGA